MLLFKGKVAFVNMHIKTYEMLTPMSERILRIKGETVLVKYNEYILDSDTQIA